MHNKSYNNRSQIIPLPNTPESIGTDFKVAENKIEFIKIT